MSRLGPNSPSSSVSWDVRTLGHLFALGPPTDGQHSWNLVQTLMHWTRCLLSCGRQWQCLFKGYFTVGCSITEKRLTKTTIAQLLPVGPTLRPAYRHQIAKVWKVVYNGRRHDSRRALPYPAQNAAKMLSVKPPSPGLESRCSICVKYATD